jgi:hypothetical protein
LEELFIKILKVCEFRQGHVYSNIAHVVKYSSFNTKPPKQLATQYVSKPVTEYYFVLVQKHILQAGNILLLTTSYSSVPRNELRPCLTMASRFFFGYGVHSPCLVYQKPLPLGGEKIECQLWLDSGEKETTIDWQAKLTDKKHPAAVKLIKRHDSTSYFVSFTYRSFSSH